MIHAIQSVYTEWGKVYRYHGGVRALARCLLGSARLQLSGSSSPSQSTPGVDCITFSVVPRMTVLWSRLILRAIDTLPLRVIIGDCTGEMRNGVSLDKRVEVRPIFNHAHGVKLDLFMRRVCRAEYVVVSDDDIFWLDTLPWQWAVEQFTQNPKVAVVSLFPRTTAKKVFQKRVAQPMGSYCLVIRRDVWLYERLSFRIRQLPVPAGDEPFEWYFDTADLANMVLLDKGYDIPVAPAEIQSHLVCLEGVSNWTLRVQRWHGDIAFLLHTKNRQEKALKALLFIDALGRLLDDHVAGESVNLIEPRFLDRAKRSCVDLLGPERAGEIEGEIDGLMNLLGDRS